MIVLSAPLYDLSGFIKITPMPGSDFGGISRRMNRVATLDGGSEVNDKGHSVSDRTFTIRTRVESAREYDALAAMVRIYPRLHCATREGVFEVAPESVRLSGSVAVIVLHVISEA